MIVPLRQTPFWERVCTLFSESGVLAKGAATLINEHFIRGDGGGGGWGAGGWGAWKNNEATKSVANL